MLGVRGLVHVGWCMLVGACSVLPVWYSVIRVWCCLACASWLSGVACFCFNPRVIVVVVMSCLGSFFSVLGALHAFLQFSVLAFMLHVIAHMFVCSPCICESSVCVCVCWCFLFISACLLFTNLKTTDEGRTPGLGRVATFDGVLRTCVGDSPLGQAIPQIPVCHCQSSRRSHADSGASAD